MISTDQLFNQVADIVRSHRIQVNNNDEDENKEDEKPYEYKQSVLMVVENYAVENHYDHSLVTFCLCLKCQFYLFYAAEVEISSKIFNLAASIILLLTF